MGKKRQNLETEVAGLRFPNPVGIPQTPRKKHLFCFRKPSKAAFRVLTPPRDHVVEWIKALEHEPEDKVLAVNLKSDIVRTFSLVYDFADFIILEPDSDNGIGATDISDTQILLEEIVSLRLCYEHYTPVFLRLSHGTSDQELKTLLDSCQLWGLNGVVAPSLVMAAKVKDLTKGRFPIIIHAESPLEGVQALQEGASLIEMGSCRGVDNLLKTLEKPSLPHD